MKATTFQLLSALLTLAVSCSSEPGSPADSSASGSPSSGSPSSGAGAASGASAGSTSGSSTGGSTSSGNTSGSSGATSGSGGSAGSADFDARCNAAGVLRCVAFDSPAEISGTWGDRTGSLPGDAVPEIDSSVKASGAGSLKFTIPSNSGPNSSGSYFANFSDDLGGQAGENATVFVQWRQRFSPELLETHYDGGMGWKLGDVGTGDQPGCSASNAVSIDSGGNCSTSCTPLEVVVQNSYQRGFAQMYHSCTGSSSHGAYQGFEEPFQNDIKLQNARPAPYCLYSQGASGSYFPPEGNCFGFFPDEWMTIQIQVETGPRMGDEFKNSHVRMWIARQGQPSEPVMDWGPYNLTAGDPSTNQAYGKVWLLPYHTSKDESQTNPAAYTWYDELVISTAKIADPI